MDRPLSVWADRKLEQLQSSRQIRERRTSVESRQECGQRRGRDGRVIVKPGGGVGSGSPAIPVDVGSGRTVSTLAAPLSVADEQATSTARTMFRSVR
jgi:hypothetical protein